MGRLEELVRLCSDARSVLGAVAMSGLCVCFCVCFDSCVAVYVCVGFFRHVDVGELGCCLPHAEQSLFFFFLCCFPFGQRLRLCSMHTHLRARTHAPHHTQMQTSAP